MCFGCGVLYSILFLGFFVWLVTYGVDKFIDWDFERSEQKNLTKNVAKYLGLPESTLPSKVRWEFREFVYKANRRNKTKAPVTREAEAE